MEEEIKKLMQSLEAAQNEAKEARDKVTTLETSLKEKDKTSLEEKKQKRRLRTWTKVSPS